MKQEYSFTLTVPLSDLVEVEQLLKDVRLDHPQARISRKTDRKEWARFYLSFPFSDTRPDLRFEQWFCGRKKEAWQLFGPVYGRWGLC